MICKNCGATFPEGVRFCEQCGTPLQQEEQPKAAESLQSEEQPKAAESLQSEEQPKAAEDLRPEEQPKAAEDLQQEERPKAAEGLQPEEQSREIPRKEAVKEKKQKAPKDSSRGGAGRVVLSVLLCFLIILAGIHTDAVFLIRHAVNEDAISSLVKELKPSEVKVGFLEDDGNRTLAEYITDYANEHFSVNMTVEEAEEVLHEKYIRKFITKKTNDYVNDLLFETGDGIIEVEEIEELWLDNLDKINQAVGTNMREDQVRRAMEEVKESKILQATDISAYREDASMIFSLIKNLLSNWIFVVGICLICFLVICLFLVQNRKRKTLAYTGSCMIVIGGINLVIYFLADSWVSIINRNVSLGRDFWRLVIKPIQTTSMRMGMILAVTGVVCCLINLLIKVIQKKINKGKAAA